MNPPIPSSRTVADLRYVLDHLSDLEGWDKNYVVEYIESKQKYNRRHRRMMQGIEEDLKKVPTAEDIESENKHQVLSEEHIDPSEFG